MSTEQPNSLVEAIIYFADADRAFEFVKHLRWANGEPVCPRCGCLDTSFISTRKIWKCKGCQRQFSIKVGTIFEDSPISLSKWLPAMWLIANSKNSISSYELARAIKVTQKTAWFMLHRIRLAMESKTFTKLAGTVEVDETYVGGLSKNVHKRILRIRLPYKKTAVQGARERGTGHVVAAVIQQGQPFKQNVHEWVEPGTTVYTDEAIAYVGLAADFTHGQITHGRQYVLGDVHTNGIENFWALLKRALKGTQVHVDPEHLQRYVTERAFAYNLCWASDIQRMRTATAGIAGRRLTYKGLIGKP